MRVSTDIYYFIMKYSGLCRRLQFTTPVQGYALQGHMIKNLSIGLHASCRDLCTMESHCMSFNLGPPTNDRVVCELSDSEHIQHPEDLTPRQGFVYRATEVRNPVTLLKISIYSHITFEREEHASARDRLLPRGFAMRGQRERKYCHNILMKTQLPFLSR